MDQSAVSLEKKNYVQLQKENAGEGRAVGWGVWCRGEGQWNLGWMELYKVWLGLVTHPSCRDNNAKNIQPLSGFLTHFIHIGLEPNLKNPS